MILFTLSVVTFYVCGLFILAMLPKYEVGGVVFYSKKQAEKYAELLKNLIKQEQELEELERLLEAST